MESWVLALINFCFLPKGSEARSGVPAFRAFQASPLLPTSLGYQGTSARPGYSAWKVGGFRPFGLDLWAQKAGH